MTDHDDVLKELDAALQVEPSRAFADGVRARVNRAHTANRNMWWGLAAAASVGLATLALWRPSVEAPAMVSAAPTQASTQAAPTTAPESVVAIGPAAPAGVAARKRPAVVRVAAKASSEPRLEVITNQGAVLRQLWAAVGTRELREAVVSEGPEASTEVKPPAPIAVDPIVVAPIVVTDVRREPGSGGATPIIRRVEAAKETR